jgi:S1-C subfamily serine protease
MNFLHLTVASSLSALLLLPFSKNVPLISLLNYNATAQMSNQLSIDQLRQLATSFTVKVFSAKNSGGSGVLIAKKGELYTVLTNAHLLTPEVPYQIQTPDGKVYTAKVISKGDSLRSTDLATLQFQAAANYIVATLGKSTTLTLEQPVFTAGFPADQQQLNFANGEISLLPAKPLKGGYQIGFTNQLQQGMSGGPVLNRFGQLIGVNGMTNVVVLEEAYTFQDGSRPNANQLLVMQNANWGIPIESLAQISRKTANYGVNKSPATIQSAQPQASTNQKPITHISELGTLARINKAAQQITVRIESRNSGNGSGIIIAHQGQTYYVLTAEHVLKKQDQYQVMAPDGQRYALDYGSVVRFGEIDLAITQFTTQKSYRVATLANYSISMLGSPLVFTSGFPDDQTSRSSNPIREFTLGTPLASEVREGFAKEGASIRDGYSLLYTNPSQPGMSGGPVLDELGRVIGVLVVQKTRRGLKGSEKRYFGKLNSGTHRLLFLK